jgi:hypothetical protein
MSLSWRSSHSALTSRLAGPAPEGRVTRASTAPKMSKTIGLTNEVCVSSQPGRAQATKPGAATPEFPPETWYVPAQYVNQATGIEDHIQAF